MTAQCPGDLVATRKVYITIQEIADYSVQSMATKIVWRVPTTCGTQWAKLSHTSMPWLLRGCQSIGEGTSRPQGIGVKRLTEPLHRVPSSRKFERFTGSEQPVHLLDRVFGHQPARLRQRLTDHRHRQ
jgi:hypothetical protein